MADIFISYSKKDVDQVRLLEAMLEAEGYTVWWDRNLKAGDDFSDTIVKQLELARAVIVLWTENSIKSGFVYAEAQNAYFHEKLVPVRAGTVGYEQIKPPFNAVHTEDVTNSVEIIKAVQERITAPKSQKYLWHQIRYKMLLVLGVVGTALTLFSSATAFIELSNWAKAIVYYWLDWLRIAWTYLFSLISVEFPAELTGVMSSFVFIGSTAIAARMASRRSAFELFSLIGMIRLLLCSAALFVAMVYIAIVAYEPVLPVIRAGLKSFFGSSTANDATGVALFIMTFGVLSAAFFIHNVRRRELLWLAVDSVISSLLITAAIFLLLSASSTKFGNITVGGGDFQVAVIVVAMVILVVGPALAPARAIRTRLVYIALLLGALLSLNGLASLGLDISAPPVPQNAS